MNPIPNLYSIQNRKHKHRTRDGDESRVEYVPNVMAIHVLQHRKQSKQTESKQPVVVFWFIPFVISAHHGHLTPGYRQIKKDIVYTFCVYSLFFYLTLTCYSRFFPLLLLCIFQHSHITHPLRFYRNINSRTQKVKHIR